MSSIGYVTSPTDFQESLAIVAQGQKMFDELPSAAVPPYLSTSRRNFSDSIRSSTLSSSFPGSPALITAVSASLKSTREKTQMSHKIRSAYSPKNNEGITFTLPSLTKQSFTRECDINTILEKYHLSSLLMVV